MPADEPEAADLIYRLFGLELESKHRFHRPLPPGRGPADLELEIEDGSRGRCPPAVGDPVYRDRLGGEPGDWLTLTPLADGWRIAYEGLAAFDLRSRRIVCRPAADAPVELIELRLLGPVLSFWLEWQGSLVLHAAAVVTPQGAIGLLSAGGGGKTTLAAALMKRGCELLADDLVALVASEREEKGGIESEAPAIVLARPAYPSLRMWPAEATFFTGSPAPARVHPLSDKRWVEVGKLGFGVFCDRPRPLRCLYVLARRAAGEPQAEVQFEPLSERDGLRELLASSFAGPLLAAARLDRDRLDRLVSVARSLPLRRLEYTAGLDRIDSAAAAVLEDTTPS